MSKNSNFLNQQATLAWLSQFDTADQPLAVELLDEMTLVSRDQFSERLQSLILNRIQKGSEPVGIYVEREIRTYKGKPIRLFKEQLRKIRRAFGSGPKIIEPTKGYDKTVGSEGIVAQIVSELVRQNKSSIFLQPGPDLIRKHRIRRFMLITDLIGSGQRAKNYLDSAWRVRSVRSWWSRRSKNGMAFEVIAYAATARGLKVVQEHPCMPSIHMVVTCPTVSDAWGYDKKSQVRSLCKKYNPNNSDNALGHGGIGALLAFAHGIPNNAPTMLYRKFGGWEPLFHARVTANAREAFSGQEDDPEAIRHRLIAMRNSRLANSGISPNQPAHKRVLLVVLAALRRPPRNVETVAAKTRLTFLEVERVMNIAAKNGWIDERNRLTDKGHAEIKNACADSIEAMQLEVEPDVYYHPKSLRTPSGVSR